MIDVVLTQHPVGQGGLMSGLLNAPSGRWHWVYDCGSNQKSALTREIAKVAAVGQVDCLFLSHLDSDHVNGIDQLLAAVPVKEVVLPYLNDIDQLLLAARHASNASLTVTMLSMLEDTPGWFGERGVERVTFIDPRDDDGEGPGPDLPEGGEDPDGGREGSIKAKWSRDGRSDTRIPDDINGAGSPVTRLMPQSATMALAPDFGAPFDWILVPFAHRPSDAKLTDFRAQLTQAFGTSTGNGQFWRNVISDPAKRKQLRSCYDVIWTDHNLVSMALYAGPVSAGVWTPHSLGWPGRMSFRHYLGEAGWLGTGDMHLDVNVRRKSFLNHYGPLLDRVNVFGLPHHGSYLNFDTTLPASVANACQFVAAAGPNGYGHPSGVVKQSVRAAGKGFVRVNHHAHRRLQWTHTA